MRDAQIMSDRRESRAPVVLTLKVLTGLLMDGFAEVGPIELTKSIEIDGAEWAFMTPEQRQERIAEEQHAWLEDLFGYSHEFESPHSLDDPTEEF